MNKSRKFAALALVIIILTGLGGTAWAQHKSPYEEEGDGEPHGLYVEQPRVFYGGLVAGANFSQVDGDYYAGYHKAGLNVGGIVYAQLARHVALSLEILYSQKGSKSNGPEASLTLPGTYILQYNINANYAEIPVMINYFDKRKSHFGVGVSYSRLVNSNEILQTDDSLNVIRNIDLNEKYPFRKNAFDFLAGFELHLVKGLFLNLRFQYSLVPIRSDIPPFYARAAQYNNMYVVRLMYLLK